MARRTPTILAIAATVAVGLGVIVPRAAADHAVVARWENPASPPTTSAAPQEMVSGHTSTVNVDFSGEFLGWAMYDRHTGVLTGANMSETSSTESMVKAWLVADYLRDARAPSDYHLKQASEAIRWSDDDAAQILYEARGGNASIERMISVCGLVDTEVHDGWWSRTQMSPRDAIKLGECLADGTAAGPDWTEWLLSEMRNVQGTAAPEDQQKTRGGGRWGIIDGVPVDSAPSVALKNGWTSIGADGNWHLNCLALTGDWTMSVMMRYPDELGLEYGAGICRQIAHRLLG
ncbi:serine hydrolase [Allorhizocola rhizosphaerae]|uniref:serine hydrolase n=1 Tax=Allorhizocola rhizosphaerae TaxID=1872709 RepID=UPI000E3BD2A2|nr:hypothetical protein [Allorhizocola rhizosphaerae]